MNRREYLIHRVVQFLSAWSLRHPRFFRYAVFLSSGEVVLCADPGGLCSGPSQIWGFFILSFYHFERSCSAFVASFSSPLDALAVSPPFGTVSGADTLLTTQVYIFWRSLLLLEPSTLFSFARARITRLFSGLPFGRLGVYCILHTLAVLWAGLGCQFRALLYFSQFNPCGEVCTAHRGESVTLNSLNSNFEHHLECDSDFLSLLNLFCSHCQNGQSVVAYIGFHDNEF